MAGLPRRVPSTFVISITPFGPNMGLDEDALREHLRRLATAGIGTYVGGGGSGEGYTLTAAEHRRVLDIAIEELQGKVPVRGMGVEPRTPAEMVRFADIAADAGVDAIQIYSLDMGHGFDPQPAELLAYYTHVLEQVRLPVVISTHQSVGYFLPAAMLVELAERYPQIIGVNCTNPDVAYLVQLSALLPDRVDLHVGGPMQALTALSLGASGYLSSEANVAPELAVSVIEQWAAGDFEGAHDAYAKLLRLFTVLMHGGGISATKALLAAMGFPGGLPRPPRLPLTSDAIVKKLLDEVRAIGITELDQRLSAR